MPDVPKCASRCPAAWSWRRADEPRAPPRFRARARAVDPTRSAGYSLETIGKLEGALAQARAELAEAQRFARADNPRLLQLRNRAEGLTGQIAEERRLFFVGLTRAQDRLYVTHEARRFRHGSEREQSPSPFLDVIDAGLFERLGDTVPARPRDRQLRLL